MKCEYSLWLIKHNFSRDIFIHHAKIYLFLIEKDALKKKDSNGINKSTKNQFLSLITQMLLFKITVN